MVVNLSEEEKEKIRQYGRERYKILLQDDQYLKSKINICIAIVCQPDYDITNFEINLIFLTKPFFYITKNSRRKIKHLENEKSV